MKVIKHKLIGGPNDGLRLEIVTPRGGSVHVDIPTALFFRCIAQFNGEVSISDGSPVYYNAILGVYSKPSRVYVYSASSLEDLKCVLRRTRLI